MVLGTYGQYLKNRENVLHSNSSRFHRLTSNDAILFAIPGLGFLLATLLTSFIQYIYSKIIKVYLQHASFSQDVECYSHLSIAKGYLRQTLVLWKNVLRIQNGISFATYAH